MQVEENQESWNLECLGTLSTDISSKEVVAKSSPVQTILKPVPIDKLKDYSKYRNPEMEYEILKMICESARHKQNLVSFANKMNRYSDIKVLKYTMVSLGDEDVDFLDRYINANYIIDPYKGKRVNFIATQGPLPTTFLHFWKMIDMEGVQRIYMICNLVENNRKKCDMYWPGVPQSSTVLQKEYEVSLSEEIKQSDGFTINRSILLKNLDTSQVREVEQIQVVGWPDHGVPTPQDFPNLLQLVDTAVKECTEKPMVVHCSAGVGRTGTFIALFYLRKLILALRQTDQLKAISIFGLVRNLKEQRYGLINKAVQYRLLYDAVAYWLNNE